jgi:hypothetical protein
MSANRIAATLDAKMTDAETAIDRLVYVHITSKRVRGGFF